MGVRMWLAHRAWDVGHAIGRVGEWVHPGDLLPVKDGETRVEWSISGTFPATEVEAEQVMEKVTDYLCGHDLVHPGANCVRGGVVGLHRLADSDTCAHEKTQKVCCACEDVVE